MHHYRFGFFIQLPAVLFHLCMLLRRALKPEYRIEALKREESTMKVERWKDGKPGPSGLWSCEVS